MMNVGELREKIENVPDDYKLFTRAGNDYLGDDFNWMKTFGEVKVVEEKKAVILVRDGVE